MNGVVLLHGGCHGSWCWSGIAQRLGALGCTVECPDLPGRDTPLDGEAFDLDRGVGCVLGALERVPPPRILVAHSIGGVYASQAAEDAAADLAALVYVSAIVPADGEAGLPKFQAGADLRLLGGGAISASPDGRFLTLATDFVRTGFYNRCSPADAEYALARICPEPAAPLVEPLSLTDAGFGSVRKRYVGGIDDAVVPPGFQRQMAEECAAELLTIDADHSPFYSAPQALVEAILSFA